MPMLLPDLVAEQVKKAMPIRVIEKDGLLRIPACRDVVERAGEFQAERADHEAGG